ncbi:MAG: glycosyltransferase family 2 protein [Patescibacteria group bacterium]|nr:glycosyltransferase family 2 protein [Patescibacteria group bacterium]
MMISVVIPFHNEKKNLPILIKKLTHVLKKINLKWEILLVDDGSTDQYQLSDIETLNEKIKLIKHIKRLGKGEALKTGIENSKGELISFIDADLQDDPEDLPKFLEKIHQGYDFVNGVRINRKEGLLIKIYSKIAYLFLKIFFHSPYKDINCGFKVFRRKILDDFIFYGNNFRFFPLYAFYQGYKVTEVPVNNHKRKFGRSKFGSGKLIGGIFDMITAFFLYKFSEKPLYFFGGIGMIFSLGGFLVLVYLAYERLIHNLLLYRRPLLFLGMLFMIVGVQITMTGIIGELILYLNKKLEDKNKFSYESRSSFDHHQHHLGWRSTNI